MYISSIDKNNVIEKIQKKNFLPENNIKNRIDDLVKKGLITDDKKSLTELGRSSIKVVLAGGVFDIIHPGHIHTLNSAKLLGDVLVVVVATDATANKMKNKFPLHKQEQRNELVNNLSMVDLCVIGHEGDIFNTVKLIKPQIIALGYDQVHQEKFITDGCKKLNIEIKVARLQSPVAEISSSDIEREYGKDIHQI